MMHPDPIVLTREEHIRQINSFWRQKDIDALRDQCLFEDSERIVAQAMYEPEPYIPVLHWSVFAMSLLLWLPIIVIGWEIFRP